MNEDLINIVMNIYQFNQDLTSLNIKYAETIEEKDKEIERLNNNINELKLCNSDYKNQICTLSSKLERINKYISDSKRELSVDCYYEFKDLSEFDEIKDIIFDKTIKLGSDK